LIADRGPGARADRRRVRTPAALQARRYLIIRPAEG